MESFNTCINQRFAAEKANIIRFRVIYTRKVKDEPAIPNIPLQEEQGTCQGTSLSAIRIAMTGRHTKGFSGIAVQLTAHPLQGFHHKRSAR